MTTTTLPARPRDISAKFAAWLLWGVLTVAVGYYTPYLLAVIGLRYIEAGDAMFVVGCLWWTYRAKVQRWLRR